jgi:hypothetical protein
MRSFTAWETSEQAQREMKQAVDLAASSDSTVLVLGESQDVTGEAASRDSLELPGEQQQLIERAVALGKPVAFYREMSHNCGMRSFVEACGSSLIWSPPI